jgi:hypothetical protein
MTTCETKESKAVDLAGAGQKLLAYSKKAEFTAKRGLVVELFPFIYGAGERMSAKAISEFLREEQKISLSSVTINKALRDPAKNWNLFFDLVEPSARTFAESYGAPMKDILFQKEFFYTIKNPLLKVASKLMVKEEVARASSVLHAKWFAIDWGIRLKARAFLEHRLVKSAK